MIKLLLFGSMYLMVSIKAFCCSCITYNLDIVMELREYSDYIFVGTITNSMSIKSDRSRKGENYSELIVEEDSLDRWRREVDSVKLLLTNHGFDTLEHRNWIKE